VADKTNFSRNVTTIRILTDLRLKIIMQKYQMGNRLIETSLTQEYNASRTSIRTALQVLENEGMIKTLPNGGKEVVGFSKKYAADMYDVRQMLECHALELAIADPSPDYVPLLEVLRTINSYSTGATPCDDPSVYAEVDIQFHRAVLRMSRNVPLLQSWETTSSIMFTMLNLNSTDAYRERYMDELYRKHKQIIDYIVMRDRKAVEIIRKHIEDAKEITLAMLEKLWA